MEEREIHGTILSHIFYRSQPEGTVVTVPCASYTGVHTETIVLQRDGVPWLILLVDSDGIAVLQSLAAAKTNSVGQQLVTEALQAARDRGAHTLYLSDRLEANRHFLMTGRTWYESVIASLRPAIKAEKVARWRHQVRAHTWAAMGADFDNEDELLRECGIGSLHAMPWMCVFSG